MCLDLNLAQINIRGLKKTFTTIIFLDDDRFIKLELTNTIHIIKRSYNCLNSFYKIKSEGIAYIICQYF